MHVIKKGNLDWKASYLLFLKWTQCNFWVKLNLLVHVTYVIVLRNYPYTPIHYICTQIFLAPFYGWHSLKCGFSKRTVSVSMGTSNFFSQRNLSCLMCLILSTMCSRKRFVWIHFYHFWYGSSLMFRSFWSMQCVVVERLSRFCPHRIYVTF